MINITINIVQYIVKLANGDARYSQMLLDIGNGDVDAVVEDYIALDENIVSKSCDMKDFVDEVFCGGLETVHDHCLYI